jgi:type I restriction enzyme S subunit
VAKLNNPKGWITQKLGDISQIYQPETIAASKFTQNGFPVYGANGIVGKYPFYNHEEWQTLVTCRGSTCGTVNRTYGRAWITGNAMVLNVDERKDIDKLFFYYLISNEDFSKTITGTGQPQIVRSPLRELNIRYPENIDEQKVIAEALSDIDELISISKNELEKRSNIAAGIISQLIDGSYFQSRSITCEFRTIKDLGIIVEKGSLITEKTARPGKIPVIAGGFKPAYYHDEPNRTGTTITVSASGANAGFVNIWREEIWASDCSTISESSEYDVRYIYYVLLGLQSEIYKSQYGGAQPHVRPNEIYNIVIPWINFDEQQVIAEILSDTFLEIKIMKNQIRKYEWLKQGMMNDLLTGKVRLV